MRFPRRFPWLLVVPIVLVFGMPLFIPLVALVWAVGPPLRSYYLMAYVDSSERQAQPGAKTEIRWVYKTAADRKPELAAEKDVTAHLFNNGAGSNAHAPFELTAGARAEGWSDVIEGPAVKVPSASLAAYLRSEIYGGESFWWLMLRPFLWVAAVPFLLLAGRAWWKSRARHEERHGRRTKGPELMPAFRWRGARADGIGFQLRFENPLWSRLPFGPSYQIPKRLESSHVLLMGDSGSGKSVAIRQLLRQVQGRGEGAIVYDPAMDFVGEFYSPARGDLILNPLDARCPYWGLGDEINREETATTIAAAFLPEKEYEKEFFTNAPRRVLAYLLKRNPQPRDLLRWMSDPEQIAFMVKGTPLAALLDQGAPAQKAGVISSLNMVANCLELLPEWEHTRSTFSTSEWYTERKRWVFLTSSPDYREKILPLHSVWLDLFILRMMGYCEDQAARPVWFVLDELASLNKLPQLHTAVTENRKYGNPVVLGFQGRSQLEKRYGQDAEAMLSQPATKVFFKTSEPRAAKWISEAIGEIEVERLKESRSMGILSSKKSYAMEIATKPLVMASEISGLAPLSGFIKQENSVVPVHFALAKKRGRQPDFIERRMPKAAPRPVLTMPAPPAVAELPKRTAAQAALPLFDPPAAKQKEVFVWDESQGID
jgi:type IV secretory pathway TraG/TraD family ATPase VirD4